MLKIIAFLALIYIFFKAVGIIFRVLGGSPDTNRHQRYGTPGKEGELHIDYDPRSGKRKSDFKGGEYVDYEEVE